MMIETYYYSLPEELIAQEPISPRDRSRLFVFDTSKGSVKHDRFYNLPSHIARGDLIIVNDSRVIPARIIGKKATGGKIEILLLEEKNDWLAMVGGKVTTGDVIIFSKKLNGTILEKNGKEVSVRFNISGEDFWREIQKTGEAPIPPYIKNNQDSRKKLLSEYQTIYAKSYGSAAAPTAGLHFTNRLIKNVKEKGANFATVDLHVGLGTFAPISEANIQTKKLHNENFSVSRETSTSISEAKKDNNRIIAVGTTSVRALESAASEILNEKGFSGSTDIFIQPGDEFKIVDGLITNFHLPKSSLMMLVAAFLQNKGIPDGREKLLELYRIAIEKKYRFYSFGDAMLIV